MKSKVKIPYHYGVVVDNMLKVLELNKTYQGFTINDNLEVIQTDCSIENNGSYNYHNNYDNSQNVLKVGDTSKWWTLNEKEVLKVQKENIDRNLERLNEEIKRLNLLRDHGNKN